MIDAQFPDSSGILGNITFYLTIHCARNIRFRYIQRNYLSVIYNYVIFIFQTLINQHNYSVLVRLLRLDMCRVPRLSSTCLRIKQAFWPSKPPPSMQHPDAMQHPVRDAAPVRVPPPLWLRGPPPPPPPLAPRPRQPTYPPPWLSARVPPLSAAIPRPPSYPPPARAASSEQNAHAALPEQKARPRSRTD